MTHGILPLAPDAVQAFSRHRCKQQTRLASVAARPAARAAAARASTYAAVAHSGDVPALRPRPVPGPQESARDDDAKPLQPRAPPRDMQGQGYAPDTGLDPRRQQRRLDASGEGNQRRLASGGGALQLAELPAGVVDPDPGRGPARRPLDVGSPRRREATLARALLRLPAAGADYGAVLSGEQLTGPEITRSVAPSSAGLPRWLADVLLDCTRNLMMVLTQADAVANMSSTAEHCGVDGASMHV